MRILYCFALWFLLGSVVYEPTVRTVFGLHVSMQSNSQLYQIVAYLYNGRALNHKKVMSKDDFVKFASGKWPSIYNPQRKDLLAENNISCGLTQDSISKKDIVFCSPLDSAWKLRYSDYPLNNGKEKGWSQELYKPSAKQIIYLNQRYGIQDLDMSFFIDSSFWKIMQDMQNPDWIKNYKSLK